MGAIIYTNGNFQGVDDNGDFIANGSITFNSYLDGSPSVTYKDSQATISNPYIIPLSASGKADIYLVGGEYTVVLKDATGLIVRTIPRFIPFLGNSGGVNYSNREEFTATAGQAEFTLIDIPDGTTSLYVNGALQDSGAYNVATNILSFTPALSLGDKVVFDYSTATSGSGGSGGIPIIVNERNSVLDADTISLDTPASANIKVNGGKRITQAVGFNDYGQVDVIEILQGELVNVGTLSAQVGFNYLYKKLNGAYEVEQTYVSKIDRNTMIGTAVYLGQFNFDGSIVNAVNPAVPTIYGRNIDYQDIKANVVNGRSADILLTGRISGSTLYISSTTTAP
jgi:hypothetical protein